VDGWRKNCNKKMAEISAGKEKVTLKFSTKPNGTSKPLPNYKNQEMVDVMSAVTLVNTNL